jgi:hypothetical protein
MELLGIVQAVNDSVVGEWMRGSLKALPIVNAIHVMAIATVFGTIFIVDLRLLGFPDARRPITRVSGELLRWTWVAFAVAAISGALLFTANANTYFENAAFRWKMLAIVLAGLNMAVFQFVTFRTVESWDKDAPTPWAARAAGALSIVLWVTVILLGRVIGFTKGYDFEVPEGIDFDFSAAPELMRDVAQACAAFASRLG